jgi:uridylate cyclase
MGLKSDLESQVGAIFRDKWESRDGQKVPTTDDLRLDSNNAVKLAATVLYADIASSTDLVDTHEAYFAAGVYKAYLRCAAKIIQNEGGTVTAYDGDRVMAVYLGDGKCSAAARTALKLNWAVEYIVNVKLKAQYPNETYRLKQVVGVDTSKLWVARTGVRVDNDLVWVGRAANYAAKMCSINGNHRIYITAAVFGKLNDAAKYGGKDKKLMWDRLRWTDRNNETIYGSTWTWFLD